MGKRKKQPVKAESRDSVMIDNGVLPDPMKTGKLVESLTDEDYRDIRELSRLIKKRLKKTSQLRKFKQQKTIKNSLKQLQKIYFF